MVVVVMVMSARGATLLVLLLARARVLEPDLRNALAEARDLRDSFQVLAVRVAVELEVRLQHLQLLLRERRPHSLRLLLLARSLICRKMPIIIVWNQKTATRRLKSVCCGLLNPIVIIIIIIVIIIIIIIIITITIIINSISSKNCPSPDGITCSSFVSVVSDIYQMLENAQHRHLNTITHSHRNAMVSVHVKYRQLFHARAAIFVARSK